MPQLRGRLAGVLRLRPTKSGERVRDAPLDAPVDSSSLAS
jgi:hypothetical protein